MNINPKNYFLKKTRLGVGTVTRPSLRRLFFLKINNSKIKIEMLVIKNNPFIFRLTAYPKNTADR